MKFQPIFNLAPLLRVLAAGGTFHFYNHESQEKFDAEPRAVLKAFNEIRPMELIWRGKVPRRSIAPNLYRARHLRSTFVSTAEVGMDLRIC